MQTFAIIMSCDGSLQKAKDIVKFCQDHQDELPSRSEEREEIFKLLLLIDTRKPKFSAAGYFTINRKTIFTVLYVTTTYIIILVQFRQLYV